MASTEPTSSSDAAERSQSDPPPAPAAEAQPASAQAVGAHHAGSDPVLRLETQRSLYWENVVREILTGLAMLNAKTGELHDGRVGVMTHQGERIPIGEVMPVFAASSRAFSERARAAARAITCTVFRIRTPAGELYTLPLKEIRGIHAMTPELMERLERESMRRLEEEDRSARPFGFAQFISSDDEIGDDDGLAEPMVAPKP